VLETPDAADALAVAICHAHHAGTARRWESAGAPRAANSSVPGAAR
jgi:crossover junction endodeoxyribonuclease RuvC